MKLCQCGSKRERHELVDARGIFVAFVCEKCEKKVRKKYRADIFEDPNYWSSEPIEEE